MRQRKVIYPAPTSVVELIQWISAQKCLSSFMKRLYRLFDKHGAKYQFGANIFDECSGRLFTLKAILCVHHQCRNGTNVAFINLFKAFHTCNNSLINDNKQLFGDPPTLCSLYPKGESGISQTGRVYQNDDLFPIIF